MTFLSRLRGGLLRGMHVEWFISFLSRLRGGLRFAAGAAGASVVSKPPARWLTLNLFKKTSLNQDNMIKT